MTVEAFVRVTGVSAEEAVRRARTWSGRAGSAVDAALLIEAGPAVIAALDETGPVFALLPLSGSPATVGRAAARLARYGASWVTVAATAGSGAIKAAVSAVAGTGARVVVETLPIGANDAAATAIAAMSRGKLVSRLAALAASAEAAAVLCAVSDLGVVAQVAPGLVAVADGITDVAGLSEAGKRGAAVVVLDGPEPLEAIEDGAPGRRNRSRT